MLLLPVTLQNLAAVIPVEKKLDAIDKPLNVTVSNEIEVTEKVFRLLSCITSVENSDEDGSVLILTGKVIKPAAVVVLAVNPELATIG